MTSYSKRLSGRRVVPGDCQAPVRVLLDHGSIKDVPEGACVVMRESRPDIVLLFGRVRAVLTEVGGPTCHAAILAREFGVPCIVGIQGLVESCVGKQDLTCEFDELGSEIVLGWA